MKSTLQALIDSRVIPWLLLAMTLATTGVALRRPRPSVPVPPQLEKLSAEVRDRERDYVKGLELIVTGDPVMGDNLLAAATDRMSVLAQRCVRTDGCDVGMFMRALTAAIEERYAAIVERYAAIVEVRSATETERPSLAAPRVPVVEQASAAVPAPTATDEPPPRRGLDLEQAITFNKPVKRALNDWLTWNRPQLADAFENYLFLREQIAPIYEKADLPEALLFGVMAQETGAKVHAYSGAGAVGPLQFMPTTGRRYGLETVSGFDMRLDPVAATKASAVYLTTQLATFGNDLAKALAAYNAGESRLGTLHRRLAGASFWDAKLFDAVPIETRNYVPAVLAATWIFMHADDYGLVSSGLEVGTTTITLREPVSIGELTICLGSEQNRRGWFRTLRNLNPRMSGNERIDAGEQLVMPSMLVPIYAERCAGNSALLARARELQDARDDEQGRFEDPPQKGDT